MCLMAPLWSTVNSLRALRDEDVFNDLTNIKIAIKKYNRICGFSMYPHGFCWHKCIALGNVDQERDHVYLAEVYMHDKKYEFEYDELLGVFWKSADAESCLSEFKSDNYDIIENGEFEIECTVSRYEINEMQWRYGFN